MSISVIIPTYQHADTIGHCLESVLRQTKPAYEIIVVDDGSTDDTDRVLKVFESVPNLRVIRQENQGSNPARNRGWKEAKGDRVIFLDADVVMQPNMLEDLSQALDEHPEASYAYSGFRFGWKRFTSFAFDPNRLRSMNFIHTSALIRCERFPGFDDAIRRFQDWDVWLTMLEAGHVGVWVPKELFRVMQVKGRMGISSWRPSFFYRIPWRGRPPASVRAYEEAKERIKQKHHLWT